MANSPEAWLRGPVDDIPALLQPVAHALLQAADEVEELLQGFPSERLWARPHGVASVGFHLQHMRGVVDRLFTYAEGKPLSAPQRAELESEGVAPGPEASADQLVRAFRDQVRLVTVRIQESEGEHRSPS